MDSNDFALGNVRCLSSARIGWMVGCAATTQDAEEQLDALDAKPRQHLAIAATSSMVAQAASASEALGQTASTDSRMSTAEAALARLVAGLDLLSCSPRGDPHCQVEEVPDSPAQTAGTIPTSSEHLKTIWRTRLTPVRSRAWRCDPTPAHSTLSAISSARSPTLCRSQLSDSLPS